MGDGEGCVGVGAGVVAGTGAGIGTAVGVGADSVVGVSADLMSSATDAKHVKKITAKKNNIFFTSTPCFCRHTPPKLCPWKSP